MIEPHFAAFMSGKHGLGREELMLEIDGKAIIPILGRYLFGIVPIIARRVVHKNGDRPQRLARVLDRTSQSGRIPHVTGLEVVAGTMAG